MTNDAGIPLTELVWPEERYARSTNLELSTRAPDEVPDYKFTSKALRLLEEVLESSQDKYRERAWSVVGPYGAGKSTFALFLLQLFTDASSRWFQQCFAQLEHVSSGIAHRLRAEVLIFSTGHFCEVFLQ